MDNIKIKKRKLYQMTDDEKTTTTTTTAATTTTGEYFSILYINIF